MKTWLRAIVELGFVLMVVQAGHAQNSVATLRGQVTDPSGAALTNAAVLLVPASGPSLTVSSNGQGMFEIKTSPGEYTLDVTAPGFAPFEKRDLQLAPGEIQRVNVALTIAVEKEKIEVSGQQPAVQVNPEQNASALVIAGAALDALPDDPDELQSDLAALAGPAPGPNGGQIYIDGFTGGQLPPKSSIREIRINQNPFAPESDKLGYGKIEVFTKPGTDNLHGEFFVSGNDSAFNSRNPFAGVEPAYESTQYNGNIGGPLSKRASFFLSVQRRNTNDLSTTNAVALDPNFNASPLSESVPNPQTRTNVSPRLDYAFGKNNTLTVHYQYYRNTNNNALADAFSLPSQAFDHAISEQTLQVSDTQIIGSNMVNETRFQYLRAVENQSPLSVAPAVTVLQAFTGGGSSAGALADRTNHYEFQNYSSLLHNAHLIKFGARLRAVQDSNISTAGFNGTFTFPSLGAYQEAEEALQSGAMETTGASQFSIITGSSLTAVSNYDVGLYAGDDWRIQPNVTLSYGLRFETQNDIHDHADFAPRLGIAWGLSGKNGSPRTVFRAGAGIFYDRFTEDYILQAERLNGITQRQFIVSDPDFFPVLPPTSVLSGASDSLTRYEIDPALHAPYTLQSAVSMERQLGKIANLAVSYLNTRGFDQLISRNINAPLSALDPVRPLGDIGNVYQYASSGIFRQNQLITNVNVHTGPGLWLFGYYVLNYANSDTAGATSFPSNQYNILADYGRAAFATRHSPSFGGTVALPYSFRLSPFFIISSGTPYNITSPYDLNGDSIFNDRPGFISTGTCPTVQITGSVYCTPLGTFDSMPRAGEKILPINYATGPGHFTVSVRLSKTIAFGRRSEAGRGAAASSGDEKGHGGFGTAGGGLGLRSATTRPYSITFTVAARNVFNHVNLATPNGTLGSPLFGESNALLGGEYVGATEANRRIDLKASFNF